MRAMFLSQQIRWASSRVSANFLNSLRSTVIVFTLLFLFSVSIFLSSSNTLNKRLHTAMLNEEIDGTTNTIYKGHKSIVLNSITSHYSREKFNETRLEKIVYSTNMETTRRQEDYLIDLTDIVITIKTTLKNHRSRLKPIIDTWFKLVPQKTYFVTDNEDQAYSYKTGKFVTANDQICHNYFLFFFTNLKGGKMVVTNCETSHAR